MPGSLLDFVRWQNPCSTLLSFQIVPTSNKAPAHSCFNGKGPGAKLAHGPTTLGMGTVIPEHRDHLPDDFRGLPLTYIPLLPPAAPHALLLARF